jgi:ubiquinol-cytochrome c reductase cytochrome b subunit
LYILFIVLLAFQVYLNISAYYAMLQGMKNYSLFVIGIMMLVFAGMFHLYRYGRALAKAPPPKPTPPATARPMPAPKPAAAIPASEKPLAAPPTAVSKVGSEKTPQLSQQQKQASTGSAGSGKNVSISGEEAHLLSASTEKDDSKGPKT